MAYVRYLHWTFVENFVRAKGDVGMDHNEVTQFRRWYNHITLSMMALVFLKRVQRKWGVAPERSLAARVDGGHS